MRDVVPGVHADVLAPAAAWRGSDVVAQWSRAPAVADAGPEAGWAPAARHGCVVLPDEGGLRRALGGAGAVVLVGLGLFVGGLGAAALALEIALR